jgi:hypothetical protein
LRDAKPVLRELSKAEGGLRRRLRARLRGVGARPSTLIEDIEAVLERALPPPRRPPAAIFEVRAHRSLLEPLLGSLAVLGLGFTLPALGIGLGLLMALRLVDEYGKLEIHADRVRVTRWLREPRELPLSFVTLTRDRKTVTTPFGKLDLARESDAEQLMTVVELVRSPVFAHIGELADRGFWFAESNDETGTAVTGARNALFIPDGTRAYDVVTGERRPWTQPRAWLLAHLMWRLPTYECEKLVNALLNAGCARWVPPAVLEEEFELRY